MKMMSVSIQDAFTDSLDASIEETKDCWMVDALLIVLLLNPLTAHSFVAVYIWQCLYPESNHKERERVFVCVIGPVSVTKVVWATTELLAILF